MEECMTFLQQSMRNELKAYYNVQIISSLQGSRLILRAIAPEPLSSTDSGTSTWFGSSGAWGDF